jgi:hypothetical protein
MDRYTVISADCHAGAAPSDYRPYLESGLHEEFDQWLAGYTNPFRDLTAPEANRNWDNAVRQSALEADGIVGEVVYHNTIPPFFPTSGLVTPTRRLPSTSGAWPGSRRTTAGSLIGAPSCRVAGPVSVRSS